MWQALIIVTGTYVLQYIAAHLLINKPDVQVAYYESTDRDCESDEHKFQMMLGQSLSDCVIECALREHCAVMNYQTALTLCELYQEEGNTVGNSSLRCISVLKNDTRLIKSPCNDNKTCPYGKTCDRASRTCIFKECLVAPTIENGKVFGNRKDVGSKIRYKCNRGYNLADGSSATAECDNGQWSNRGHCTPVSLTPQPSSTTTYTSTTSTPTANTPTTTTPTTRTATTTTPTSPTNTTPTTTTSTTTTPTTTTSTTTTPTTTTSTTTTPTTTTSTTTTPTTTTPTTTTPTTTTPTTTTPTTTTPTTTTPTTTTSTTTTTTTTTSTTTTPTTTTPTTTTPTTTTPTTTTPTTTTPTTTTPTTTTSTITTPTTSTSTTTTPTTSTSTTTTPTTSTSTTTTSTTTTPTTSTSTTTTSTTTTPTASTSTTTTSTCGVGQYWNEVVCEAKVSTGEQCPPTVSRSLPCIDSNAVCKYANEGHRCRCKIGYFYSSSTTSCQQSGGSGEYDNNNG